MDLTSRNDTLVLPMRIGLRLALGVKGVNDLSRLHVDGVRRNFLCCVHFFHYSDLCPIQLISRPIPVSRCSTLCISYSGSEAMNASSAAIRSAEGKQFSSEVNGEPKVEPAKSPKGLVIFCGVISLEAWHLGIRGLNYNHVRGRCTCSPPAFLVYDKAAAG